MIDAALVYIGTSNHAIAGISSGAIPTGETAFLIVTNRQGGTPAVIGKALVDIETLTVPRRVSGVTLFYLSALDRSHGACPQGDDRTQRDAQEKYVSVGTRRQPFRMIACGEIHLAIQPLVSISVQRSWARVSISAISPVTPPATIGPKLSLVKSYSAHESTQPKPTTETASPRP